MTPFNPSVRPVFHRHAVAETSSAGRPVPFFNQAARLLFAHAQFGAASLRRLQVSLRSRIINHDKLWYARRRVKIPAADIVSQCASFQVSARRRASASVFGKPPDPYAPKPPEAGRPSLPAFDASPPAHTGLRTSRVKGALTSTQWLNSSASKAIWRIASIHNCVYSAQKGRAAIKRLASGLKNPAG